jgi:hypothetical protein
MLHAMLNRATMRVADTTEVSGRVTADSIKHELCAKKQSSLWRLTIFGFCKVCSLVAATLILPALAYAQNNQGDDQGDGRPGIKPGIPNGTYVSHITGLVPAIPPATGLAPIGAIVRLTYFPNAIMSGGITSGVASFSVGGTVLTGVPIAGTFTVNGDGSVTEIDTQTSGPGLTLHFILYPTPDANTIAILETDTGTIASGVETRGR